MRIGDTQPTTGSMEGHCELDLTIKPSGGAEVGPTHLDYAQFPQQDMEVTCQSNHNQYDNESNTIVGSTQFNGSVVSKIDAYLIDVRNDAYKFLRVLEMSHPAGHADDRKSQLGMNFTHIRGEAASNNLAGSFIPVAKASKSQISGKYSNSGCMTSMLSHVENASKRGNENDINPTALQFGHLGIGDGSFLRLGIGGGLESRSNSNFSALEISSKLAEVNSSPHNNHHAQKTAGYHMNLAQSMDSAARLQFNGGELSNVVSRTSTFCEGAGLITGANGLIGSNSCFSPQIPEVNMQRDFSFSADRSSGLRHDQNPLPEPYSRTMMSHPGYAVPSPLESPYCRTMMSHPGYAVPSPLESPYSRTMMSHPGYAVPSPLESQLTKFNYFTNQPVSVQQQNYSGGSSINVSPESFSTPPIDWRRGNSVRHSQLRSRQTQVAGGSAFPLSVEPHGNLAPTAEGSSTNAANIGSFQTSCQPTGQLFSPQNFSATEAHGYHLSPGRRGFPVPKGSTFQSVVSNPLPRRLIQPVDFAAARAGPSLTGLDSHINHLDHTVSSGQHVRAMPSHLPKDFPKDHFDPAAQFVAQPQAFPIPHNQSLKRGAVDNSTATQPNYRRRIIHGPIINGSVPHQRKWLPAPVPTPAQIPSAPFHIKFQDFDGPPKPHGYNCFLCKRDLAFTAEGPVYQPAASPAVAVLPCGHVFHDSCLQRITPEDQSKQPTCIPCATGET